MARPSEPQAVPALGVTPVAPAGRVVQADPELERELLQAMSDFENGDYTEFTVEQLEHYAATGESPWLDESHS